MITDCIYRSPKTSRQCDYDTLSVKFPDRSVTLITQFPQSSRCSARSANIPRPAENYPPLDSRKILRHPIEGRTPDNSKQFSTLPISFFGLVD